MDIPNVTSRETPSMVPAGGVHEPIGCRGGGERLRTCELLVSENHIHEDVGLAPDQ